MDINRVWCQPYSLLQGHAIWHCGCALAVVTAYNHFRQFGRYSGV
jgi:hypothetical protein